MTYSLYYYDSCPFCQMVLRVLPSLNVYIEKRNILKNESYRLEQANATGRNQVPCLRVESEAGEVEWIFESADIIRYIRRL